MLFCNSLLLQMFLEEKRHMFDIIKEILESTMEFLVVLGGAKAGYDALVYIWRKLKRRLLKIRKRMIRKYCKVRRSLCHFLRG